MCMHLAATVLATTKLTNEQSRLDVHDDNGLSPPGHDKPDRLTSEHGPLNRNNELGISESPSSQRFKRHSPAAANSNNIELNPNAHIFVRELFKQFGNVEHETMNVTGFEQMLKHLGLDRMIEDFSQNVGQPKSSDTERATHHNNNNETVRNG